MSAPRGCPHLSTLDICDGLVCFCGQSPISDADLRGALRDVAALVSVAVGAYVLVALVVFRVVPWHVPLVVGALTWAVLTLARIAAHHLREARLRPTPSRRTR